MNLKDFLENYEMNLEYFDLDAFEDEIMDIPYQIKILKEHFYELNEQEKQRFFYLNKQLKSRIEKMKPKNELQKRIILEFKKLTNG